MGKVNKESPYYKRMLARMKERYHNDPEYRRKVLERNQKYHEECMKDIDYHLHFNEKMRIRQNAYYHRKKQERENEKCIEYLKQNNININSNENRTKG